MNCPSCAAPITDSEQWRSRGVGDAWTKELRCSNCNTLFRLDAIMLKKLGGEADAAKV